MISDKQMNASNTYILSLNVKNNKIFHGAVNMKLKKFN